MKTKFCYLPFILMMALTACSQNTSQQSSDVSSSGEIEVPLEKQIIWSDCLSQEEQNYLVFFYSKTCANCHEIMGDVLAFSEENIIKTYFSDINATDTKIPINRDISGTLGIDNINDFYIAGTPTIIEVYEGTVTANIPGKDACLTFLNEQRLNNEK